MQLGGEDMLTLTGKMTGCWLTTFVLKATGGQYFGHIGTGESWSDPLTLQAKKAWCNAVREGKTEKWKGITPLSAYNPRQPPADYGIIKAPKEAAEVEEVYGAIDRSGTCYTVVLGNKNKDTKATSRRVAYVCQRFPVVEPPFSCDDDLLTGVASAIGSAGQAVVDVVSSILPSWKST
jgi:hypothetical protein